MLIRPVDFERIKAGAVDTAFRRWTRPTVRAGGTLTTSMGVLAIEAVDAVAASDIGAEDVRRAGFVDHQTLMAQLDSGRTGTIYRIRMHYVGDDPRAGLRQAVDDLDAVEAALARLDARGAWTRQVLDLIEARPATLAQTLADAMGMEKLKFKNRVRQLKGLGLTESLEVGYRLSPRGAALLARWRAAD